MRIFVTSIAVVLVCASCIKPKPPSPSVVPQEEFVPPTADNRAVKVYSEVTYVIETKPIFFGSPETTKYPVVYTGTGFLRGDRLVTARHVLTGPDVSGIKEVGPYKLDGKNVRLADVTVRIRVSDRSFAPTEVAWGSASDIAFMKLSGQEQRALKLQPFSVGGTPRVGDHVQVWGFPTTVAPQVVTEGSNGPLTVVAVYDAYFVLNARLESGFSGGPVLSVSDGKCLGVAVRTEEKQARVMRLKTDNLNAPFTDYTEGMSIPGGVQKKPTK
jgi:S1-C subfamily serine protease